MRVAVWKTGHEIADTVADAIMEGLDGADIRFCSEYERASDYDINIGYGILRGCDRVFNGSRKWVHLDRGYWGAAHFSGNYRISLNGTQQAGFWPLEKPHGLELKPWRGFDHSKPVLVCPPTLPVANFFGLDTSDCVRKPRVWWHLDGWDEKLCNGWRERIKGNPSPINFQDYSYVLTFNSSVGWQAIQAGIPCVSNPTYSMVGSFFKNNSLAELSEKQYIDRERLFRCMSAQQMTLDEMRQGELWRLVESLLKFSSATMTGNPSHQKSPNIQYLSAQNLK